MVNQVLEGSRNIVLNPQDVIIEPQDSTIKHPVSTGQPKELTNNTKESTTEPQDSKELVLVLTVTDGPPTPPPPPGLRVLNNNCDKDVDKIVLAVLKKLEKEHYIEMKAYLLVKEMVAATMTEELGSEDNKETMEDDSQSVFYV